VPERSNEFSGFPSEGYEICFLVIVVFCYFCQKMFRNKFYSGLRNYIKIERCFVINFRVA
jgi:hypothetical protein